jgi:ABC-type transporter Mla MlaB component
MTAHTRIELAPQLGIAQAAELHRSLCATLVYTAVEVDGTRVEEVDTAILQLLVSFWRTRQEQEMPCSWSGVSEVLRRAATLLGLTESLHFPDRERAGGGSGAID